VTAPIRVLIVDDEPLARRGVRARLAHADGGDVQVVGECGSGREAVDAARRLAPDLVFLDVQMPGLDGFGVVDALAAAVGADALPVIVFVTAYDQHAMRAFEAQALDYLLKPIDDARFERALARARRRVAERRESALGRRVAAALADVTAPAAAPPPAAPPAAPPAPTRFQVSRGGRSFLVPADAIDWVGAEGDYVALHVGRERHLLRGTMAWIEERLDPRRFARIHRSTVVNVDRVRELLPYSNRELVVVLHDGTRLKLSRGYRDRWDAVVGAR